MRYSYDRDGLVLGTANAASPAVPVLARSALDGHVEQDVLGVEQTQYVVDMSAATPGYGDHQGSTARVKGRPVSRLSLLLDRILVPRMKSVSSASVLLLSWFSVTALGCGPADPLEHVLPQAPSNERPDDHVATAEAELERARYRLLEVQFDLQVAESELRVAEARLEVARRRARNPPRHDDRLEDPRYQDLYDRPLLLHPPGERSPLGEAPP